MFRCSSISITSGLWNYILYLSMSWNNSLTILFTACIHRKIPIKKEEKIVVDKTLCALILKQNCQTLHHQWRETNWKDGVWEWCGVHRVLPPVWPHLVFWLGGRPILPHWLHPQQSRRYLSQVSWKWQPKQLWPDKGRLLRRKLGRWERRVLRH